MAQSTKFSIWLVIYLLYNKYTINC